MSSLFLLFLLNFLIFYSSKKIINRGSGAVEVETNFFEVLTPFLFITIPHKIFQFKLYWIPIFFLCLGSLDLHYLYFKRIYTSYIYTYIYITNERNKNSLTAKKSHFSTYFLVFLFHHNIVFFFKTQNFLFYVNFLILWYFHVPNILLKYFTVLFPFWHYFLYIEI